MFQNLCARISSAIVQDEPAALFSPSRLDVLAHFDLLPPRQEVERHTCRAFTYADYTENICSLCGQSY